MMRLTVLVALVAHFFLSYAIAYGHCSKDHGEGKIYVAQVSEEDFENAKTEAFVNFWTENFADQKKLREKQERAQRLDFLINQLLRTRSDQEVIEEELKALELFNGTTAKQAIK